MKSIFLEEAIALLLQGEVIAFPTETVFGLGANAYCDHAVEKIYKIKNRPSFNPLISHYSHIDHVQEDLIFNEDAMRLAKAFWPGPLTLILPKKKISSLSSLVTAGLPTAAARIPSHDVAQALLQKLPFPLAAPSANPSGSLSATSTTFVAKQFQNHSLFILPGTPCTQGIESTIVDVSNPLPSVLRAGTITHEEIEKILQKKLSSKKPTAILSPGLLLKHYSPSCPVRLGFSNPQKGEALLAFGKNYDPSLFQAVFQLSLEKNLQEAAHNLYHGLLTLSETAPTCIAVMPIPNEGIGRAINDRLQRAAASKDYRLENV